MTSTDVLRSVDLAGQVVLVTGATGFLGSALCQALIRRGADVHGTSRQHLTSDGSMRWWQADLSQPERISEILRDVRPSVVFHLASHVSGDRDLTAVVPTARDNLLSTIHVLTAACEAGGPRIVLAGSMEEADPALPDAVFVSPYAAAKTAARVYAGLFTGLFDLPVVHLRIYMVYGPGQRDTGKLVPYVTTSLLRGDQPKLSSGAREIDWIYVDDVVSAFLAAAETSTAIDRTIDIGSGELITVRSIVERLSRLIGGQTEPLFGALEDRPLEHRRIADVRKSFELIGWKPQVTLDVGLRRTVQWFRERGVSLGGES